MNLGSLSGLITNWPTDWIILGAFAILVALDAYRSGSARAATLALVAPLSLVLTNMLSQAAVVGPALQQLTTPAAQTAIFAVIFAALFFLVHRSIYSFSENGGTIQGLVAGISASAVLSVVWLEVPALQALWHFGPQVQAVFGEAYRFWWLIGAYGTLAIIRG